MSDWRDRSAEEARRHPDRYVSGYPHLVLDLEAGVARVGLDDFRRLDDYSFSRPTGVYLGKVWREGRGMTLGTFRELDPPEPDACETLTLPIVLTNEGRWDW